MGAYLFARTGFTAALDPAISNRKRILIPLLVGLGFALVEIGLELAFHGTKLLSAKFGGTFNVDFPASLIVYTSGVTMIESFLNVAYGNQGNTRVHQSLVGAGWGPGLGIV